MKEITFSEAGLTFFVKRVLEANLIRFSHVSFEEEPGKEGWVVVCHASQMTICHTMKPEMPQEAPESSIPSVTPDPEPLTSLPAIDVCGGDFGGFGGGSSGGAGADGTW